VGFEPVAIKIMKFGNFSPFSTNTTRISLDFSFNDTTLLTIDFAIFQTPFTNKPSPYLQERISRCKKKKSIPCSFRSPKITEYISFYGAEVD